MVRATENQAAIAPASAWLARITDRAQQSEFIMDCIDCHQVPAPEVRHYAASIADVHAPDALAARRASWGMIAKYMNYLSTWEFGRGRRGDDPDRERARRSSRCRRCRRSLKGRAGRWPRAPVSRCMRASRRRLRNGIRSQTRRAGAKTAFPSATRSRPIRPIRAGRRPRPISWSDRFVIPVTTRAGVRDGRVLAPDGLRRHVRRKGEDSGARKPTSRAGPVSMAASIGLIGPGTARYDARHR